MLRRILSSRNRPSALQHQTLARHSHQSAPRPLGSNSYISSSEAATFAKSAFDGKTARASWDDYLLTFVKKIKFGKFTATDHIPFLADEANAMLQFITPYLKTNKQLAIRSMFQAELQQRNMKQQLSYEWWLIFAYRISILVTKESERVDTCIAGKHIIKEDLWLAHDNLYKLLMSYPDHGNPGSLHKDTPAFAAFLKKIIGKFPHMVLAPTTIGHVPIETFNHLIAHNALPLGVTAFPIDADGITYNPDQFITHDIDHAAAWMLFEESFQESSQLLCRYIVNTITNENNAKLKSQLGFMLFLITHERQTLCFANRKDGIQKSAAFLPAYDISMHQSAIKPFIDENKSNINAQISEYVKESVQALDKCVKKFFDECKVENLQQLQQEYKNKSRLTLFRHNGVDKTSSVEISAVENTNVKSFT